MDRLSGMRVRGVDACRGGWVAVSLPVSPDGPGPVHLDINLKRGVWITGRLIDRETQKPVRGQVEYYVFVDNPRYQAYRGFGSARYPSRPAWWRSWNRSGTSSSTGRSMSSLRSYPKSVSVWRFA